MVLIFLSLINILIICESAPASIQQYLEPGSVTPFFAAYGKLSTALGDYQKARERIENADKEWSKKVERYYGGEKAVGSPEYERAASDFKNIEGEYDVAEEKMYRESKDWLMAARVDDCSRSSFQCRPETLIPKFASVFNSFDKSFDRFVKVGEKRSRGIENLQRALNQWKNELEIKPAAAHATTPAPQSNSILAKIKRTIKKFTSLFSKSENKVAQPEPLKSVPKTEFQRSMEEFESSLNTFKMDSNKFQNSALDFQKAVKRFKDSVEAAERKYH